MGPRAQRRTWRSFGRREARVVRAQLATDRDARCPRCSTPLEARPSTRLKAVLPDGADGYDLDCRQCRQFFPRVRHTDRSLYLLRMQRLAAAIRRA